MTKQGHLKWREEQLALYHSSVGKRYSSVLAPGNMQDSENKGHSKCYDWHSSITFECDVLTLECQEKHIREEFKYSRYILETGDFIILLLECVALKLSVGR